MFACLFVCLFLSYLTSKQQKTCSSGSDLPGQLTARAATLTHKLHIKRCTTDTQPTSPGTDPITPGGQAGYTMNVPEAGLVSGEQSPDPLHSRRTSNSSTNEVVHGGCRGDGDGDDVVDVVVCGCLTSQ